MNPERILSSAPLADVERLKQVLSQKAQYLRTEKLERHVLANDGSLVIERRDGFSMILRHIGDAAQGPVEEVSVKCRESDFEGLVELFTTLGYQSHCVRKRVRSFYEWFPVLVQLDEVEGFGIIIELLLYGQMKAKKASIEDGLRILHQLGLERISEEELKKTILPD